MLQPGETAPDFSVPDETGQARALSEFAGRTVSGGSYDQKYSWVMRVEQGIVREVTAYLDTQLLCEVLA